MGAEPRQGCTPESRRRLCFGLERRKKVKNSLTAIKAEEWRERRARGSYGLEREGQICPNGDLNTSVLWVGRLLERHRAKGLHGHPVEGTLHPSVGRH